MSLNVNFSRKADVDHYHNIRDPTIGWDRPTVSNARVWANTIRKKRIAHLFDTLAGLKGHVEILQNEINRTKKIEGLGGEIVCELEASLKLVRSALKNAMKGAKFPLPGIYRLNLPLLNDTIVI